MEDNDLTELIQRANDASTLMETLSIQSPKSPTPSSLIPDLSSASSINEPVTPPYINPTAAVISPLPSAESQIRIQARRQRRLAKKCLKRQARDRLDSLWHSGSTDAIFYGLVVLAPRPSAGEFAQTVCQSTSSLGHLSFWTAASAKKGQGFGYAVTSQFQGESWTYRLGRTDNARGILHAQMLGIQLAMEQAVCHVKDFPPTPLTGMTVRVFSDSHSALRRIRSLPFVNIQGALQSLKDVLETLEAISDLSQELDFLGAKLEIHWVPASEKVDGVRIAKSAAKYARLSTREALETDWTPAMPARPANRAPGDPGPSNLRFESTSDDTVVVEKDVEEVAEDKEAKPWLHKLRWLKGCF